MNMQKISSSLLVRISTNILILLAIAKVLSLTIWWFLPSDGVELQVKKNYKPSYQRVDFKNMLVSPVAAKAKQEKKSLVASGINITNMVLKGLYGEGNSGMAIVALKSSLRKTSVVAVGEAFSGYTLKTILLDAVIFTKDGKDYTLSMAKSKEMKTASISSVPMDQVNKEVTRKDINDYIENRKDIWRDITIDALKEGNNIKGFKVKRINSKSELASLGLEKGDVIVAANNVALHSYKDVLDIYKNIKNLKTIQLIILRNNQEQELIYEIK